MKSTSYFLIHIWGGHRDLHRRCSSHGITADERGGRNIFVLYLTVFQQAADRGYAPYCKQNKTKLTLNLYRCSWNIKKNIFSLRRWLNMNTMFSATAQTEKHVTNPLQFYQCALLCEMQSTLRFDYSQNMSKSQKIGK